MGYFSNGTEGLAYRESFCERCINWRDLDDGRGPGCPVIDAHVVHNYDECNNTDSILHMLIPRDESGENGECLMFIPAREPGQPEKGADQSK